MKGLMKSAASLPRFALDCGFWRTRRYAGASPAVVGLQTAAISYCYEHGTDGWVPDDGLATSLGFRERDVAKVVPEMVRRNLWVPADGDGFLIVGFLDHNPSRKDVQAERDKRTVAGQKGNHDRWHQDQSQGGCQWCSQERSPAGSQVRSESDSHNRSLTGSLEKTREDETREDETRECSARIPPAITNLPPDPPSPSAPGRKGHRIPDDFEVTTDMLVWAKREAPGVALPAETAKFRDYWQAESGQRASKVDWTKAWQVWVRKASEGLPNRNGHGRPVGLDAAAEYLRQEGLVG